MPRSQADVSPWLGSILSFWPLLVTPLLIALPNLLLGSRVGDDFSFHIQTWLDAAAQHRLLPDWADGANFSFGDARFQLYPPISWALGGLLARTLPLPLVVAAYFLICGISAAFSMYLLARQCLTRTESLTAACFYPLSPYFLYDLYGRAAYAEALAMAILPASVALFLRLQQTRRLRDVALFAVSFSLICLTNIPLAAISSVTFLTLTVNHGLTRRDWRFVLAAAWSALLAGGLIASYLAPAVSQFAWVDSSGIGNGVRTVADFTRVNSLMVAAASLQTVAAAVAIISIRGLRAPLLVITILALVFVLPLSLPLWSLPGMRMIQFPFRWLSVLAIPFGLAAGRVLAVWPRTLAVSAALSLLLLLSAPFVLGRRPAGNRYMAEVQEALERGTGYQKLAEHTPRQFRFRPGMEKYPPVSLVEDRGDAAARTVSWTAGHRVVAVSSQRQSVIRFRLAYYPAWRVVANGSPVPVTADEDGVLLATLPPGHNMVEVSLDSPPGRSVGLMVSLLSATIVLYAVTRRRRTDAGPN